MRLERDADGFLEKSLKAGAGRPLLSQVPPGTNCTELNPASYAASSSDRIVNLLSHLKSFSEGSGINRLLTSIDDRHLAALVSFVRRACLCSIVLLKY